MRFPKKIVRWLERRRVNKRLRACKYVHLMFNDFFNKPFVDFLNRHFDPSEHLVLCKRWFDNLPFPDSDNVIEVTSFKGLDFSTPTLRQVICHSLFDSEVVDLLYEQKSMLQQKAWWIVWGGDLYGAPRDEKNDYVRGHFYGYLDAVDFPVIQQVYGARGRCCNVAYQFPVRKEMLDHVIASRTHVDDVRSVVRVQVNNSCDASTIPILKILSRYKNNGITVRVIVSYGDLKYKDEILRLGREFFGGRFEAVETLLSPEEYARKLDEIDVLVLNQSRQQGIGNTVALMYLGKKIFVRSDVTTFRLNDRGAVLSDTLGLAELSWDELIANPADSVRRNFVFALGYIDEKLQAAAYRAVFEKD